MSSISFRRPEFRLHLGYPDIILTHAGRTLGRVATAASGFSAALTRLTEPVRRARGRLVVVLPESEVWRGRLDLAGRGRAERRASARSIVAGRLGAAPDDIALVLGPRDAGGSFPVAGVRRSTLLETRALARRRRPPSLGDRRRRPLPRLRHRAPPRRLVAPPPHPAAPAARPRRGGRRRRHRDPRRPRPRPAQPGHRPARQPRWRRTPRKPRSSPSSCRPSPRSSCRPPRRRSPSPPPSRRSRGPRARWATPLVTVAARNMPKNLPIEIEKPKPNPVQRLADARRRAAPARSTR